NDPRAEGPKIRPDHLAWSGDGKELLVTLEDGSPAALNGFTAKAARTLDIVGFEKTLTKSLESARVLCAAPDGKTVIEGLRAYPPEMRGMDRTCVLKGDEK